jgi:hypothetical protein
MFSTPSDPYTGTLTVGTGTITGQTTISTIQATSSSTVTITSPLLQVLQLSGATGNVMEVEKNATIQGTLAVKTNATTNTLTTTGTASFTNINISGQFLVQGVDVLALRNQIMQLV